MICVSSAVPMSRHMLQIFKKSKAKNITALTFKGGWDTTAMERDTYSQPSTHITCDGK